MNELINHCRVCGYDFQEPPWGESDDHPTYLICDCCGSEAGIHDQTVEHARRVRKYWIEEENARWYVPKSKPKDWSLEEQLKSIPEGFRYH